MKNKCLNIAWGRFEHPMSYSGTTYEI